LRDVHLCLVPHLNRVERKVDKVLRMLWELGELLGGQERVDLILGLAFKPLGRAFAVAGNPLLIALFWLA
jgi:hypothetical protein